MTEEKKRNLPAITDLYENREMVIKKNDLTILLNQPPSPKWIKKNPISNTDYVPIEIVEWLLTSIFAEWWVEITNVSQMLNSAVVTVRLHYTDPITGKDSWQDGVGAHNFQLDKGAGTAVDFEKLKAVAVKLAVPIAESEAFKDAAHKIGKIFGKDLNRKNSMSYNNINDKFNHEQALD